VSQSIEPTYQNLFVKSNLSGDFTVVNMALVDKLKALGLWDEVMVNDLKYYDGSIASIDRVSDEIKNLFAEASIGDAHIRSSFPKPRRTNLGISGNTQIFA